MYHYCTCSKDPKKKSRVENGRTPYREVKADSEGTCLDCGYYVTSSRTPYDPSSGSIYMMFMKGTKPPNLSYVGGLSLKSQKTTQDCIRRGSDQRGETKDGDLDV